MDIEKGRAFLAFHRENPKIYEALVRLANEALNNGKEHGSIQLFWEQLRWQDYLGRPDSTDPLYRLNNNWRGYYARWLEYQKIVPVGFFEFRQQKEEE
jgi:hypothetical protein